MAPEEKVVRDLKESRSGVPSPQQDFVPGGSAADPLTRRRISGGRLATLSACRHRNFPIYTGADMNSMLDT